MRSLVFAGFLVGACVRADLIPCGESLCPQDKVCAPDGRCLPPSLLEQCEGRDDGAACDALEGIDGRCANGVCEQVSCGNGFVDDQLHETCDGSTDTQCVDFGFDLGRPSCTGCAVDTASCTRFGWVRVEYASSQDMWTDGTILAYTTYSPQGIVVHGGGYDATSPRRYYALDGGDGQVYALSDAFVVEHATPTGFEDLPAAPSAIADIAVSDDGIPFVLGFDCRVYAYRSAAWSEIGAQAPIPTIGGGCSMIAVQGATANTKVVVASPSGPFWVSTDLTHFVERPSTVTQVSDVKLHEDAVYFVYQGGVARASLTMPEPPEYTFSLFNTTSIAFVGDHYYVTSRQGLVVRVAGKIVDSHRGPTGGRVTDDGHGGLYMYQGPIHRFTGIAFGELGPPELNVQEEQIAASCRLGDRVLAMSDLTLFRQGVDDTAKWDEFPNPLQPTSYRGLACSGDSLIAVVTHIEDGNSLLGLSNVGPDAISLVDTSSPVKDAVWIAPDGTVIVVGSSGQGATANTSPGWAGEIAPGWETDLSSAILDGAALAFGTCRFYAVHGLALSNVVAAGRCDDKGTIIERVSKNNWRVVYQSPTTDGGFRAVLRTANRIFAAGDRGAAWFDGTVWHTDPTVIGRTLSGSETDLWLSGAFTNVQHFDGTQWSQVATAALSQIAVLASEGDIVFPGGAQGHVNLIRDRQVVPP